MMYRMMLAAALLVTTAVDNPVMAVEAGTAGQGVRTPLVRTPPPRPPPHIVIRDLGRDRFTGQCRSCPPPYLVHH
jgi:hypothetical protein